jgi:hypothetical protein
VRGPRRSGRRGDGRPRAGGAADRPADAHRDADADPHPAEDPGPYPGLQLDGLETVWDEGQQVWTLAGMVVPPAVDGVQPERFVALWATDQDPTREDFAGTIWTAVNGSDMVSAAPPLESFPPLTMDGPGPIGLWCGDFYPELAGRVG